MLLRLIILFVLCAGFSTMGCESSDGSSDGTSTEENTDGNDSTNGNVETDELDTTTDSNTSEVGDTELFPHAVGNYCVRV